MRIFVVDDDPIARNLVQRFLIRAGHTVVGDAPDGAAALEILSRVTPDAIVTDFQMPNLDGISMVRKLRAAGNVSRIIMLSGQSDRAVIDAALHAGVDAYLTKPMDAARLIAAVSEILGIAKPAA